MKKIILVGAFLTLCLAGSTYAQSSVSHSVSAEAAQPAADVEVKDTPKASKASSCCSKKSTASSCSSAKAEAKSCSGAEAKVAGKSSCCQKGGHGHADAKIEEKADLKQKN